MVGNEDQSETQRGASVLNPNFEHMTSTSSSVPSSSSHCCPHHMAHLLQSHVHAGRDPFEKD